jgi:hypothetical protein
MHRILCARFLRFALPLPYLFIAPMLDFGAGKGSEQER